MWRWWKSSPEAKARMQEMRDGFVSGKYDKISRRGRRVSRVKWSGCWWQKGATTKCRMKIMQVKK